ncbi:MAG: hypothetical protein QOH81_2089 [Sphingomonadales bacterium]|jgi:hypothetical protein|nr:hypothetical protein [Sphingomonadales bacterium]
MFLIIIRCLCCVAIFAAPVIMASERVSWVHVIPVAVATSAGGIFTDDRMEDYLIEGRRAQVAMAWAFMFAMLLAIESALWGYVRFFQIG